MKTPSARRGRRRPAAAAAPRPPAGPAPAAGLRGVWPLALLVLLCLGVYGRSLGFEFTRTDDTAQIVGHADLLARPANAPALFARPFFTPQAAERYYRPVVALSYMLDAQWAGPHPRAYHASNLAIHAAAVCLFFLLARRLLSAGLALGGAAVLAVHPGLTEAVAWIPGRGDSLLGLWLAAALLWLLRFRESRRLAALCVHLGLVLLALFTKEAAVALPAVLAAYLLIVEEDRRLVRDGRLWLGWGAALGLWGLAWRLATGGTPDPAPAVLGELVRHLPVVLVYLGKAAWPAGLSVLATERDSSLVPGLLALPAVAAAGLWLRGRLRRLFLWGVAGFVLLLLPSLPLSGHLILEIRLYAPLMMLAVAALAVARQALEVRPGLLAPLRVAAAALAATLAAVAFRYSASFRDADAFSAQAVRSSPRSAHAHLKRGIQLQSAGRSADAEEEYRTALALDPGQPMVRHNLGALHLTRGELAEAERLFREELRLNPADDKAHYNLAVALMRQGRLEAAAASLHEALRHNPGNRSALEALAQYHEYRGEPERAAVYRERLRRP